jgi:hypothetical protein
LTFLDLGKNNIADKAGPAILSAVRVRRKSISLLENFLLELFCILMSFCVA